MRNRCRNKIIPSVVKVINSEGSTRIKMMYGSFLSHSQLNEYLSFMPKIDLMSQQKSKQGSSSPSYFIMTEKGMNFLNLHNQIKEMITIIQTK